MNSQGSKTTAVASLIERAGVAVDLPSEVRALAVHIFEEFHGTADTSDGADGAYALAALGLGADVYTRPVDIEDLVSGARERSNVGSDVGSGEVRRLAYRMARTTGIDTLPRSPHSYVDPYCERLDLPVETREVAKAIVERFGPEITGRDPTTVAAAAVYTATLVTGQRVSQEEIERATGVTPTTLRPVYRRQYEYARDL